MEGVGWPSRLVTGDSPVSAGHTFMATFQCKRSGNRVSFSNEDDIRGLRSHEGYTEVFDESVKVVEETKFETPSFLQPVEPVKQRGRPKKVH